MNAQNDPFANPLFETLAGLYQWYEDSYRLKNPGSALEQSDRQTFLLQLLFKAERLVYHNTDSPHSHKLGELMQRYRALREEELSLFSQASELLRCLESAPEKNTMAPAASATPSGGR